MGIKLKQIDIMGTKLKSRQWHLADTLPRGDILSRITDNVTCHIKDLTCDNLKKKIKKKLKN